MNLYLRLLWLLISFRFKPSLKMPFDISRLSMRVLPNDLDPNLHLNNGRYFTLADLGRTDLMLRGELWRAALKNGWMPILSAATIRFRRELRLFQRFEIQSRIVYWNERHFVMEQRFVAARAGAEEVAAVALVRGGLYERKAKRFVEPEEIFSVMGYAGAKPEATADVLAFLAAEEAMKQQQAMGMES